MSKVGRFTIGAIVAVAAIVNRYLIVYQARLGSLALPPWIHRSTYAARDHGESAMLGAVPTTPRDLSGHRCRLALTAEDAAQNLSTPERGLGDEHGLEDDPLLA